MLAIYKCYVFVLVFIYFVGVIPGFYISQWIYGSKNKKYLNCISKYFALLCVKLFRVRVSQNHRNYLQKIDWSRPVFFVGNHSSWADIPILIVAADLHLGFIAKQELKKIPFLGFWIIKGGGLLIDRKRFLSSLREIQKLVKSGSEFRIVIFPEGTRSKTGEVGPFKVGGLSVAWNLEAQVVPFGIVNSRNSWENRKGLKWVSSYVHFGELVDFKEQRAQNLKLEEAVDLLRSQVIELNSRGIPTQTEKSEVIHE